MTTSRYRRVNLDGQSLFATETRAMGATALLPATFAVIDPATNTWVAAAADAVGRLYVLGAAEHQGLGIRDAIPVGASAVGNYVEEGREFAVLVPAGTYKKDQAIKIGASGQGAAATLPADAAKVVGYCQDEATISGGDTDYIRVRMRRG